MVSPFPYLSTIWLKMKLLSNDAVASYNAMVRAVSIKAAFEGKTFIVDVYSYNVKIFHDKFFQGYNIQA